jgi:hypothetical protein
MIFTDEFFIELNNEYQLKNFPSLLLLDLPKESDLKKGNLTSPENPNQIYVFATTVVANGYLEIKTETKFDVIFSRKQPIDFVECNAILKFVNLNPRQQITSLSGGNTGMCLVEFTDGKPEILDKLGYYELKDYKKDDMLILTQKEVLHKLMNKMKAI